MTLFRPNWLPEHSYGVRQWKIRRPNWRTIYEAAVLERDSSKALQRIAQAEEAIMFRLEALKDSPTEVSEGELLVR